jgi:hypothetical protein
MVWLRWLSVLLSLATLVLVIVGNVRSRRLRDSRQIRQVAARLGRGIAGAFVFTVVAFVIAALDSFHGVADADPGQKALVLASALAEPTTYLVRSLEILVGALVGLAILRFRAGYHSKESDE